MSLDWNEHSTIAKCLISSWEFHTSILAWTFIPMVQCFFLKNVYPWTKGSFSPLKLLSLDALQNQTPNPQNVKVAYLRSPPAPKFKDLMMASNLHNTSALTQMLKNDSSILCVMKVDYKPINFTKIKFNTLRTLEIFKSLANNMKGQNSSGK